MEPRGGSLNTTGRAFDTHSISRTTQAKEFLSEMADIATGWAFGEIAMEGCVENAVLRNICNILQDLEMDPWSEVGIKESKYELIGWSGMLPTVGAVIITKGSEQAGPSLQVGGMVKESITDKAKFRGSHRDRTDSDQEG